MHNVVNVVMRIIVWLYKSKSDIRNIYPLNDYHYLEIYVKYYLAMLHIIM